MIMPGSTMFAKGKAKIPHEKYKILHKILINMKN